MTDLMVNIKNLRKITGAGFLDCKKALEENKNDIENSIDFLRKKGLAKANKKLSREANEGAVGIFSNDDFTNILQINTETDFAAKNEVFLNFMEEIGNFSLNIEDSNLTLEDFNIMIFENISISDRFKSIISKIGENIILTKLLITEKTKESFISQYIHNPYKKNIGKIAVILKSEVENLNEEAELLGKNLCMHIAASKPLALDIEHLDNKLLEKERAVQLEIIKESNKPNNIVEKILNGKMKKFYSESTFMNQRYIMDSEKTISDILNNFSKENKFKIINYYIAVLVN